MADAVSPEWIADLRNRLGLTQSEFAGRLGVTNVTVSRWETGQVRPNKLAQKTLAELARTGWDSSGPASAAVRELIGEADIPGAAQPDEGAPRVPERTA